MVQTPDSVSKASQVKARSWTPWVHLQHGKRNSTAALRSKGWYDLPTWDAETLANHCVSPPCGKSDTTWTPDDWDIEQYHSQWVSSNQSSRYYYVGSTALPRMWVDIPWYSMIFLFLWVIFAFQIPLSYITNHSLNISQRTTNIHLTFTDSLTNHDGATDSSCQQKTSSRTAVQLSCLTRLTPCFWVPVQKCHWLVFGGDKSASNRWWWN